MTKQSSHCTFGPDFAVTDKNRESKEYGWWRCALPFIFTTEFHSTPRLLKIKIKKRTKNLHVLLKPPMFQYGADILEPGAPLHFHYRAAPGSQPHSNESEVEPRYQGPTHTPAESSASTRPRTFSTRYVSVK